MDFQDDAQVQEVIVDGAWRVYEFQTRWGPPYILLLWAQSSSRPINLPGKYDSVVKLQSAGLWLSIKHDNLEISPYVLC